MDKNTRWVFLGFLGLGILTAWVMSSFFQTGIFYIREWSSGMSDTSYAWFNYILRHFRNFRDVPILGNALTLSNLLGMVSTFLLGYTLWKNERVNTSAHEVIEELNKVTWPDSQDTKTSTIVVIITTIIIALVLWVFDFIWSWATGLIYGTQG